MKDCRSMTLTQERSVGVLLSLSKRIYLMSSLMLLLFLDPTLNLDHGFFTILLRRNKAEGKVQKVKGESLGGEEEQVYIEEGGVHFYCWVEVICGDGGSYVW